MRHSYLGPCHPSSPQRPGPRPGVGGRPAVLRGEEGAVGVLPLLGTRAERRAAPPRQGGSGPARCPSAAGPTEPGAPHSRLIPPCGPFPVSPNPSAGAQVLHSSASLPTPTLAPLAPLSCSKSLSDRPMARGRRSCRKRSRNRRPSGVCGATPHSRSVYRLPGAGPQCAPPPQGKSYSAH